MTQSIKPTYVYGLDAVRFLCSVMVGVFHLTWHNRETVAAMPFGWIGVQIFFVISGVVIAGSAANANSMQFLKRRFLRLYPAAWIAACINICLLLSVPRSVYLDLGIWVVPSGAALMHSVALVGTTFLASAYWTLPIELSFYGLVLIALYGGGVNRLKYVARMLVTVCTPYLILLFLSYAGWLDMRWLDLGYGPRNMLLLRHGVYFAAGIYLWLITSQRAISRVDVVMLGVALGAAGLEIYVRSAQNIGDYAVAVGSSPTLDGLMAGALATFFICTGIIFFSLRNAAIWVPSPNLARSLRTLGLTTYPFYLLHEVTGGWILYQALRHHFSYATAVVVALVGVVLLAGLVALYAEPWLRRLVERGLRAAPTPRLGKFI